jgi:hypothetical protein
MSLAYPVARSLEEAIAPGVRFARSARDAAAASPGEQVEGLETSWLHLPEDEARKLLAAQGAEGPAGHLQLYEDTSGHVVIAVNWWKLVPPGTPPRKAAPVPPPPPAPDAPAAETDHTDDLYFRRGRTKTRRRKPSDPNQLDLFKPDRDA